MVFAKRDENDLLSTWLIKGTSSYGVSKGVFERKVSCNKYFGPSVRESDHNPAGDATTTSGSLRLRC